MYEFDIITPNSIDAAKSEFDAAEDGQFLAGGQTLIPVLKQRLAMPSDLIDLEHVHGLSGISAS